MSRPTLAPSNLKSAQAAKFNVFADIQLTAVYAENQDVDVNITTLNADCPLTTLQSYVTAVSSEMVFSTRMLVKFRTDVSDLFVSCPDQGLPVNLDTWKLVFKRDKGQHPYVPENAASRLTHTKLRAGVARWG